MSDLGPCSYCGAPAVVTVNGGGACMDHIDELMEAALAPAREALRIVRGSG